MLSRETGLCLNVLRFLAERPDADESGCTPIPEIARGVDLSPSYASKLCRRLRGAGYLQTRTGAAGGVGLSPLARESTLLDLAKALADPFVASRCVLLRDACDTTEPCPMHDQWAVLHASTLASFRDCPVVRTWDTVAGE